ncbi:unnamed protein product [Thelazia callipaeda]|uniref:CX domain-containing protein n=1 Tax=Thelazia callipaeda TaxID=103827 RepID=A0A0N5CSJ5_THECL|nr:unnamed protein product [Thelazia callipaeda]
MIILAIILVATIVTNCEGNPLNYGWNPELYNQHSNHGYSYGSYGYQPAGYGPAPYSYYQPHQQHFTPSWSGFRNGFRNFIYPVYSYLPSVGNLLKSGAYGALKGAGVGAAIGGVAGLIG